MVIVALGIATTLVAVATRDLRRSWKPLLAFGVVAAAVTSPWLIRNLVWTRNPVFPLAMSTLGRAHFDEVQVERFRIAHSPSEKERPIAARIKRAGTVIFDDWQYGYLLWPTVAVALALAWRRREAWLIETYLLIVLIIWIGFTHLLGRFYVLTIPVAAMSLGLVRWKPWPVIASVAAVLLTTATLGLVHPPLEHFAQLARNGFFGLDDLSVMIAPGLTDMKRPDVQVGLIGDAEGFFYQIPSARLHYRTVFDLPGNATDMYEAWLGVPEDKANGLLVLSPPEVERLSRTYYRVPGLPSDFARPREEVQIIRK
jgi:hypothetical protein